MLSCTRQIKHSHHQHTCSSVYNLQPCLSLYLEGGGQSVTGRSLIPTNIYTVTKQNILTKNGSGEFCIRWHPIDKKSNHVTWLNPFFDPPHSVPTALHSQQSTFTKLKPGSTQYPPSSYSLPGEKSPPFSSTDGYSTTFMSTTTPSREE